MASRNVTDLAFGPELPDRLAEGLGALAALDAVTADRPHIGWRQLLVVDAAGQVAIHSGAHVLGLAGGARGCAQAMVRAFESSAGDPGDRLMLALATGLAAGGDAGPVRSAGKMADRLHWPVADLRSD